MENGIGAAAIPDGRHVAASPGFKPADLEFLNVTVHDFMRDVTNDWKRVQ